MEDLELKIEERELWIEDVQSKGAVLLFLLPIRSNSDG